MTNRIAAVLMTMPGIFAVLRLLLSVSHESITVHVLRHVFAVLK